ncbi:MAG TPA: ATP synthase F1 subunit gamma [Elusimicrobiota bacterium]|nr:ATP synthase F1 subunit gamma [Elusimicrobiota bacterium]
MASLREIRRKIKSVKSTQQITKAMKMVAAARLRRAQARILAARPFAQKMEELMHDVVRRVGPDYTHPLMLPRTGEGRILLLVTSDKGLCGAFNSNLIREAQRYIQRNGLEKVELYIVGRKGRDYYRRIGFPIQKEYINITNNVSFAHAELIAADLVSAYSGSTAGVRPQGDTGSDPSRAVAVDILYNEFKTVIQQRVVVKPLLPILEVPNLEHKAVTDFEYEPAKEILLEGLVSRFIKAQVYRILMESSAAELGARMASMDNASRNAADLISSLTLTMNRTRQFSITKEILEVVSGAEALK